MATAKWPFALVASRLNPILRPSSSQPNEGKAQSAEVEAQRYRDGELLMWESDLCLARRRFAIHQLPNRLLLELRYPLRFERLGNYRLRR